MSDEKKELIIVSEEQLKKLKSDLESLPDGPEKEDYRKRYAEVIKNSKPIYFGKGGDA